MVAMMKLSGKLRWLTTMSINFYHLNFHGYHSVDPSMRLTTKQMSDNDNNNNNNDNNNNN